VQFFIGKRRTKIIASDWMILPIEMNIYQCNKHNLISSLNKNKVVKSVKITIYTLYKAIDKKCFW